MRALGSAFSERLRTPVDAASLRVFRLLFGLLLFVAIVRSLQKGIVEQAFIAPQYVFPYYGFEFVHTPGAYGNWLYSALAVLALCIAFGIATRCAAAAFCLLFTYAHFVDVTNYLNHYYLVSLLTALLAAVPIRRAGVPRWTLWLFRFQFGVVYFFGGVAKLKHDWLLLAQPLHTWLAANTDVPWLGHWFADTRTAYAFSWLGAFYDLTITFFLLYRRTRPYAYAAVVFFHLMTARLFNIGLFPYLMMAGSLLFLAPDWPAHLWGARPTAAPEGRFPWGARQALPLAFYALVQVLVPLRHWLYPGNVLWTEQGYRFSWNVMLIEKTGAAQFRVVDRATSVSAVASPRRLLTRAQTKAMATQPDMILAFAHELARRAETQGRHVAVYADVFVVLNGRAPARLIDPTVDLAREPESFANKRWILPGPN